MRNFVLAILTILLFSCKDDEPKLNIEENVEINLSFSIYDCECDGIGLPSVEILSGNRYIYHPDDIPNEIKSQTDWQNKEYIATLKIKDETCECELGVDPIPGNPPPTENLQKAEIIEINEK